MAVAPLIYGIVIGVFAFLIILLFSTKAKYSKLRKNAQAKTNKRKEGLHVSQRHGMGHEHRYEQ